MESKARSFGHVKAAIHRCSGWKSGDCQHYSPGVIVFGRARCFDQTNVFGFVCIRVSDPNATVTRVVETNMKRVPPIGICRLKGNANNNCHDSSKEITDP